MVILQKLLSIFLIIFISACSGTYKVSSKADIKLYVFECGDIDIENVAAIFPGVKDTQKHLTVSCYLIKHPQGNFLWDTGLNDKIGKNGIEIYLNGTIKLKSFKPLMESLKEIGIAPESINYLALSHFHTDHAGNANNFTNATLLVQKNEYDAAFGKDAKKYGFDPENYNKLRDNKVIKLTGDYDIFKDGSIIIKSTPGHNPGHQSLFINLVKTGPVVLSGNLYHFTKGKEIHSVPEINFDKKQTAKTMNDFDKFVNDNKATLWIGHDFEQNQTIKHSPEFYE